MISGQSKLPKDFNDAIITLKGGKGSGNWGHGGLEGVWGGSTPTKSSRVDFDKGFENIKDYVYKTTNRTWDKMADTHIRSQVKNNICIDLSEKAGLGHNLVNNYLGAWAETSNRSWESYEMQKAVSEIMGVEPSDWQKKKFVYYEIRHNDWLNITEEFAVEALDRLEKEGFSESDFDNYFRGDVDSVFFDMADEFSRRKEKWIKDKYGIDVQMDIQFLQKSIHLTITPAEDYRDYEMFSGVISKYIGGYDTNHISNLKRYIDSEVSMLRGYEERDYNNVKKLVKAMYDNTQQKLKEVFPNATHLILYRGVKDFKYREEAKDYKQNVIEAWSLNPNTAKEFSGTVDNIGYYLKAIVPVSKVFSSCLSGFGCLSEYEFVVMPGDYKVEVEKFEYLSHGLSGILQGLID